MALLTFEGFESKVNGNGGLSGGWTDGGPIGKGGGLLGGSSIGLGNSGSAGTVVWTPPASTTHYIVGFRFQWGSSFFTQDSIQFFDSAGAAQCGIGMSAANSGHLFLWRGALGTVVAGGATTLNGGNWYFIEIDINMTGSHLANVTVLIDGVTEFSVTGVNIQNTANQNMQAVQWRGNTAAVDDVYVLDSTGSAPLNAILGPCRVETQFPTAAASTAWTPNASTNVSQIQDASFDADTTFNSSTASGDIDLFTHGAMSNTPSTVYGVRVMAIARKDDNTSQSFRTKLKSGATVQNGATINPQTGYNAQMATTGNPISSDLYTTDPATGVAWTAAAVNATQIGYEHV